MSHFENDELLELLKNSDNIEMYESLITELELPIQAVRKPVKQTNNKLNCKMTTKVKRTLELCLLLKLKITDRDDAYKQLETLGFVWRNQCWQYKP